MHQFIRPIMFFLMALVASPVTAHPGHAVELAPPNSISHYFVQPSHPLALVLVCLLAALVVRSVVRRCIKLPVVGR